MKLASKTRLKKLEAKMNGSREKHPLSIFYTPKEGMLYIKHISCGINEFFSWSGVLLLLPDSGRRDNEDFLLTSEYMRKQPEIAEILKKIAEKENLELVIDIPHPKSNFNEDQIKDSLTKN